MLPPGMWGCPGMWFPYKKARLEDKALRAEGRCPGLGAEPRVASDASSSPAPYLPLKTPDGEEHIPEASQLLKCYSEGLRLPWIHKSIPSLFSPITSGLRRDLPFGESAPGDCVLVASKTRFLNGLCFYAPNEYGKHLA